MIQIRKMTIEDCNDVAQIDRACFSDAWSISMFEDLFRYPVNHYYVAEVISPDTSADADGSDTNAEVGSPDSCVIGFAGILTSIDTADVMNIGVLPAYRRQGIGEKLLQQLEEDAKTSNCFQMMLEVRDSNTPAIELYQKYGFTQIAVRKRYYSNPTEDGRIMQKNLQEPME